MTVKEIFDHPDVKAVEIEILDILTDEKHYREGNDSKLAVQHLLSVRSVLSMECLNGQMNTSRCSQSLITPLSMHNAK